MTFVYRRGDYAAHEFEVGECVTAGEDDPAIVVERQAGGNYALWNVYDDNGRFGMVSADKLSAVEVGGETCRSCPYWTGRGCGI